MAVCCGLGAWRLTSAGKKPQPQIFFDLEARASTILLSNSSLKKSQSKLTHRQSLVLRLSGFGRKSPDILHSLQACGNAPPQKHFAAYLASTSILFRQPVRRSHSCMEASPLGLRWARRLVVFGRLPCKGRRGYESALLAWLVLLRCCRRVRGGGWDSCGGQVGSKVETGALRRGR